MTTANRFDAEIVASMFCDAGDGSTSVYLKFRDGSIWSDNQDAVYDYSFDAHGDFPVDERV
jgi:hypothetical protein